MSSSIAEKSVSVQVLGDVVGVSARRINQLVKEKWVPKSARNTISLKGGVQGYIAFLEDRHENARPTATDDELRAERARKLRLENDCTEGKLVEMDEALNAIDVGFGAVRVGMAAVPARVTRDLALRQKIEDEINRALTAVAEELEKRAVLLQRGENPEAAEEDDTG